MGWGRLSRKFFRKLGTLLKRKSKKLSRKLGHVFAEKRKLRPEKRKLRRGFGSKAKFGRKSAEIRTFCGGLGPLRPKSTTLPEHNVGIATPSPGPLQNGPLSTTSHLEKNESFTKVRTHVPRKAKRKLGTFKTKVCPTPSCHEPEFREIRFEI